MHYWLVAATLLLSVTAQSSPAFRRGQVSGIAATMRAQRLHTAIGFGAFGLGVGIAGAVVSSNAVTDGEKQTGAYALGVGAGMAVGAVLLTFLRNPYERAADEFLRLSANESADAVEKRFQDLVESERRQRRFVSIVNLAVSGAIIAIGFASSSNTKELLIGFGAGGVASSLFSLLFPPPMPFEALGDATAQAAPPTEFRFGVAPVAGGAMAAAGLRF